MRYFLAFLSLTFPLIGSAQSTPPPSGVVASEGGPHAPIIGVRVGFASGKLRPTDNPRRYHAQAGWAAALLLSSNPHKGVGVELEAAINCVRFTDSTGTRGGASYRWITAQPTLLGFVRPGQRVQLLGGVGINLGLSCWRWPFQAVPGAYGFGGGDQASGKTSAPGAAFVVVGARGDITPRLFLEGRYATTLGGGGYRFYKSEIAGSTTWWSASVGFWLNPRPASASH
ncbi:MAG: hypothetical protein H7330_16145 [Hymenobacteraceae bacterium]|nr:hypothetical protein [Hymenobacteraceae bacterium]